MPQPVEVRLPASATSPDAAARLYAGLAGNLSYRQGNMPLTLLVTSLAAQAGKTRAAMALARAAAATGVRVLVIDASQHAPALAEFIPPGMQPDLIDLMGTMRLCYDLPDNISIVPIIAEEGMIVRRLMRREATRVIDGIKGHFDVVVLDGGTIGGDGNLAMVAQAADSVVLATSEPRPARSQIDQAMADLGVPRHRFGGVVAMESVVQSAA